MVFVVSLSLWWSSVVSVGLRSLRWSPVVSVVSVVLQGSLVVSGGPCGLGIGLGLGLGGLRQSPLSPLVYGGL